MSTTEYTLGQRWVSDAEPELGLGSLIQQEGRTITLFFPATGETRIYAAESAPITRVILQPGDITESVEGWILTITSVRQEHGLCIYAGRKEDGTDAELAEGSLSSFLQFNRPQERLLNGLIDDNHWFELRRRTLEQRQLLAQSDLIGLNGARIELLPHQLYIAHEVGKRLAPRVLLADEVGLGKTIESCLILHRQLLSGKASRALIVVPEPLLHQWLVELVRRFNLRFSLFDEERCDAISASGQGDNPFLAEQLVICSLSLLTDSERRRNQAVAAGWDILIVDEAHHLEWRTDAPSPAYQAVEMLAMSIPGVLLLTATPEQLGQSGHFARLRLLDPSRFHCLDTFMQEQEQYQPVAEAATQLLSNKPLTAKQIKSLSQLLKHDQASQLIGELQQGNFTATVKEQLIEMLLDRHGTGRVLFRNTRSRIKGFSPRKLHSYPLVYPSEYQDSIEQNTIDPLHLLHPETIYNDTNKPWWQFDPRVEWLINKLRELNQEKVLLICSSADTAMGLEQTLRQREGMPAALFHERRSIIERDRAAAWFADQQQGCQILICSEIGSEGRNFQFAHHLILFDLPANPDLLEQRIGRLDRIGQRHSVQLHAPYFQNSAQEIMLRWYHEGLNACEQTCAPGQQIFTQIKEQISQCINSSGADLQKLIADTRELYRATSQRLEQGRDHLLELNSCRMRSANELKGSIEASDNNPNLPEFMSDLCSAFNLETEPHSEHSQVIRPGAHMHVEHFPHMPADGLTVTFDRPHALAHEDRQFLTWEHPMVRDAMEMLLEREEGNSCAMAIKHPNVTANSIFLELLFVLECPAPRELESGRFLPSTLIRTVIDQNCSDLNKTLTPDFIAANSIFLEKKILGKLITPLRKRIQEMLHQGEQRAESAAKDLLANSISKMRSQYELEIERLVALQQINPNIRPEEIGIMQEQRRQLESHMASSKIRLDAVRLIVAI